MISVKVTYLGMPDERINWCKQNIGEVKHKWDLVSGNNGFYFRFDDHSDALAFRLRFGL